MVPHLSHNHVRNKIVAYNNDRQNIDATNIDFVNIFLKIYHILPITFKKHLERGQHTIYEIVIFSYSIIELLYLERAQKILRIYQLFILVV